MLTTKYPNRFRSIVAVSLLLLLTSAAICQSQPPASAKKGKANAESCDGAADIVPVKPMSFARKRRPSTKEQSGEAKPNKS